MITVKVKEESKKRVRVTGATTPFFLAPEISAKSLEFPLEILRQAMSESYPDHSSDLIPQRPQTISAVEQIQRPHEVFDSIKK